MYRYLSRDLTNIPKNDDLLKIMYICQMYRFFTCYLTHMHDEHLCCLKIAILEKCQITLFLTGYLMHIHKNIDLLESMSICQMYRYLSRDLTHIHKKIYLILR